MHLSRIRLSVAALFADLYSISLLAGVPMAMYVALARRPLPSWTPFLSTFLILMAAILYHALFARRLSWRTPGELICGRRLVGEKKYWVNPYSASRGLLFVLAFIALMSWVNFWDSVVHEHFHTTLTIPVVLGRSVLVVAGLYGLIMLGQGRSYGAYVVGGVFALSVVGNLIADAPIGVPERVAIGLLSSGALLVLYAVFVGMYYGKRVQAEVAE